MSATNRNADGSDFSIFNSFMRLSTGLQSEFHREADIGEALVIDLDSLISWALEHSSLSTEYGGISFISVLSQIERFLCLLNDRKIRYDFVSFDEFGKDHRKLAVLQRDVPGTSFSERSAALSKYLLDAFHEELAQESSLANQEEALARAAADLDDADAEDAAPAIAAASETSAAAEEDHEEEEDVSRRKDTDKDKDELGGESADQTNWRTGAGDVTEVSQLISMSDAASVSTDTADASSVTGSDITDLMASSHVDPSLLNSYRAKFPYQYLLLRQATMRYLSFFGKSVLTFVSWYTAEWRTFLRTRRIFAVVADLKYNRANFPLRSDLMSMTDLLALGTLLERISVADIHSIDFSASTLTFSLFIMQKEKTLLELERAFSFTSASLENVHRAVFSHVNPLPKKSPAAPVSSKDELVQHIVRELKLLSPLKGSAVAEAFLQTLTVALYLQYNAPLEIRLVHLDQIAPGASEAFIVSATEVLLSSMSRILLESVDFAKFESEQLQCVFDILDPRFVSAVMIRLSKSQLSTINQLFSGHTGTVSSRPGVWTGEAGGADASSATLYVEQEAENEVPESWDDDEEPVDDWEDMVSDEEEVTEQMEAMSISDSPSESAVGREVAAFVQSAGFSTAILLKNYGSEDFETFVLSMDGRLLGQFIRESPEKPRDAAAIPVSRLLPLEHTVIQTVLGVDVKAMADLMGKGEADAAEKKYLGFLDGFRDRYKWNGAMKAIWETEKPKIPTDARALKRYQRKLSQKANRLAEYAKSLNGGKDPRTLFIPAFLEEAKKKKTDKKVRDELRDRFLDMVSLMEKIPKPEVEEISTEADEADANVKGGKKKEKKEKEKPLSSKEKMLLKIKEEKEKKEAAKQGKSVEELRGPVAKKRTVLQQLVEIPDDLEWSSPKHDPKRILRLNNLFYKKHAHLQVAKKARALRLCVSAFDDKENIIDADGTEQIIPLNVSQRAMMDCIRGSVQFEPDLWQIRLMEAICANVSSLVVGPTSVGKSFLSYVVMERILREDSTGRVVFVAPSGPLVTQTYSEVFGLMQMSNVSDNKSPMIGFASGEDSLNEDARILVTKPEILNEMLLGNDNAAAALRENLRFVVFDEIHNISGDEGEVWAQNLQMISCPYLALSASVGNSDEIYTLLKLLNRKEPVCLIQVWERVTDLVYGTFYPEGSELKVSSFSPLCFVSPSLSNPRDADRFPAIAPRHVVQTFDALRAAFSSLNKHGEATRILVEHFDPATCDYFNINGSDDPEPVVTRTLIRKWDANLRDFIVWSLNDDRTSAAAVDLNRKAVSQAIESLRKQENYAPIYSAVDQDPVLGDPSAYYVDYQNHPVYRMYKTLEKNKGLPALVFDLNRSRCSASARHLTVFLECDDLVSRFLPTAIREKSFDDEVMRRLFEKIEFHVPSATELQEFCRRENVSDVAHVVATLIPRIREAENVAIEIREIENAYNEKDQEYTQSQQQEKAMRSDRPGANKGGKIVSSGIAAEMRQLEQQRIAAELKLRDLLKVLFCGRDAAAVAVAVAAASKKAADKKAAAQKALQKATALKRSQEGEENDNESESEDQYEGDEHDDAEQEQEEEISEKSPTLSVVPPLLDNFTQVERLIKFLIFKFVENKIIFEDASRQNSFGRFIDDREVEDRIMRQAAFRHGIGAHHNKVWRKKRFLIESLFRLGKMKCVFATGTLAQGVNMACRSAVFFGGDVRYLYPTIFQQCAGRAGRRGFKETFGSVYFFGMPSRLQTRFVCSDLPFLHGKYPLSSISVLKLMQALPPQPPLSANASLREQQLRLEESPLQRSVRRVLEQPLQTDRMLVSEQLLFQLEFLAREGLMDRHCQPREISHLVTQLWKTAPHVFFMLNMLAKERFTDPKYSFNSEQSLMQTLVARLLEPRAAVRGYPFERILPSHGNRTMDTDMREYTSKVLSLWSKYVSTMRDRAESSVTTFVRAPLFALFASRLVRSPERRNAYLGDLFAAQESYIVGARSVFSAVGGGLLDIFTSKDDIVLHAWEGVSLDPELIALADNSALLDSCLMDFFRHRSVMKIVVENHLYAGETVRLIKSVNNTVNRLKVCIQALSSIDDDKKLEEAKSSHVPEVKRTAELIRRLDSLSVAFSASDTDF
eukprot:ANDGO_00618.mRNA.1 putative helicase C694.02